jgi:hypothetical protein
LSAFGMLFVVTRMTQQALLPVQQTYNGLRTQVAEILNPTPTILPDPVTIINNVRSLARLETIRYAVEKVITAESGQGFFRAWFGDKLLLVAHGLVIAGVDLEKLTPADLMIQDGMLRIHLPDPEVFSTSLDNDKSYIYDRQTGVFTHGDPNLETQARQVAEDEILNAALADGILIQAKVNAESYLSRLLNNLGFRLIAFIQPTSIAVSTRESTPTLATAPVLTLVPTATP